MHRACCVTFKTARETEDSAAMLRNVGRELWNEYEMAKDDFGCREGS